MMTSQQAALWQQLRYFELDDPKATLPFSARLARENGWDLDFTLRAIDEYKKFLLLAATLPHPVTPSDPVDQVWHLHLLYTHSYWEELCGKVLGKPLHHAPTRGGIAERSKFNDWYNYTLKSYVSVFDCLPPEDLWPTAKICFRFVNFRRVNTDTYWIIPKPTWLLLIQNALEQLWQPRR
ncbi:MAG: hypothetical protein RMJ87_11425 [Cytophagales bacterium]|nr:hypothetical protein [Bernardetiaceae bacterium]MDW8205630.1 hypothetical protein [Cytophagales bacterium]